jgi:hypothetical protein
VWRRLFKEMFGHYIVIVEFTKSGRVHFHVIVQVHDDIRTGFDFTAYAEYKRLNEKYNAEGKPLTIKERRDHGDIIGANHALRAIWKKLDRGLTRFGFGPVYDIFPIETNEVAVSRYVTKEFLGGLHLQQGP